MFKRSAGAKGRIGVAIEGDRIALAMVAREGNQIVLKRCEVLAVDPAGGPAAAASTLRTASLPRLPVSVVLRSVDYQIALVETPDVPPAELRAAMRWRLKDAIDFRVEDAVIDLFDMPAQNRGSQGRMMYAVAARREAVERCALVLSSLDAFDVVDVPELCLRNLASGLPEAASGVALLHLSETSASVILVRGTTFYFSRQMELRKAQATPGSDGTELDSDSIILELQRSLDYYERHFDQPPIMRIAISPAGRRAAALAMVLKRDSGFEVSVLDLNSLLRCAVPVEEATQVACLMAVGAALREERRSL